MMPSVRRIVTYACACALAARLLVACGDGNVTGQDPPVDDAGSPTPYPLTHDGGDDDDAWTELWDDAGSPEKGHADVTEADASRADASRDAPAAPDPCAMRDDGTYCAALLGLPTPGLLRCASRRSAGVTPCMSGCLDRPGATDACLDDSIDPCFDERDGLYCGRTIGASTRPDDAFRCMYRRTTWSGACSGGCAMTAGGVTCQQ